MNNKQPIEDKLLTISEKYENGEIIEFPANCPICLSHDVHLYYNKRDGKDIGSVWIWCSLCNNFFHGTSIIPSWWTNYLNIDKNLLTVDPGILEDQKNKIDEHTNLVLKDFLNNK